MDRVNRGVLIGLVLVLMAAALPAQTVPVATPVAAAVATIGDQYRVGAGVSYDYYGKTGFATLVDIDARTAANSNIWYHVSLEMTAQQAVLKPGAEYELVRSGNWGIALFGDAGLATGSGATLGAFAGGGKVTYDFGSKLTQGASHYYAEFAAKVTYLSGTGGSVTSSTGVVTTQSAVQPVFSLVFTKGF